MHLHWLHRSGSAPGFLACVPTWRPLSMCLVGMRLGLLATTPRLIIWLGWALPERESFALLSKAWSDLYCQPFSFSFFGDWDYDSFVEASVVLLTDCRIDRSPEFLPRFFIPTVVSLPLSLHQFPGLCCFWVSQLWRRTCNYNYQVLDGRVGGTHFRK